MLANKNCIIRLSRYKNSLYRLRELGFVKVFSDNLADAVGVTATQVRKDFSLFGIQGNKKGGYEIASLLEKLNAILGKDKMHKVLVVGAGHIGSALLNYQGFEKEGIKIVAVFDIDPAKFNRNSKIPVLPLEELKDFVKAQGVTIGIIAVPEVGAQQAADALVYAGIKGILNFAPLRIKVPEECVVNNVNLELELENLIYFVNVFHKQK
ncbi:MAG: redox-sensing transcriptional repressor Rex [Candidatus Omnitrophica bacterium]|nr:redox-sensing transcriptional repressor Rex [Candidatus Omnitrophota bacterium]